jgi:hypothetical protein
MDRFDEDAGRSGTERADNARTGAGWTEERFRDTELGEQLRRLEVPEHGPDFFATLEEELKEELEVEVEAESRRAARGSDDLPSGRRVSHQGAASRADAGRRPARQRRRSWLRYAWIPIPVALAILLLLWAFAGPLGIDPFEPQPASAAEIVRKATEAVANLEALRATFTSIASPDAASIYIDPVDAATMTEPFTFIATAEGDYRLWKGSGGPGQAGSAGAGQADKVWDIAYDNETGVHRSMIRGYQGLVQLDAWEAWGYEPGHFPNWFGDLNAAVRALRESPEAGVEVTEGTYEGQPVWILSSPLTPSLITNSGFDHVEVTVLQESGLMVRAAYLEEGELALQYSLSDLEINPQLPAGIFTLEFPAGVEWESYDNGFRSIDVAAPAEAQAVVGYVPVLPARVPEGFVLADMSTAEMGSPSGTEAGNPATPGMVTAVYRRGFDQLVVSTRTVGDDPSLWSDPLSSGEGYIDNPEKVTLAAGAFAGSGAELVINIRTPPHLWAMNDTLVVTVSGDLTRDELLAVAESLAPVE